MHKRGALIIGVSIIIGFLTLGLLFKSPIGRGGNDLSSSKRYQMISPNENNIIILDTQTGEYWRKFVSSNQGPSNWTKEIGLDLKSPIESQKNESSNSISELNRYQMISANDNNILLLDSKTGECWRRFIPTNEGPTNWTKEIGPEFNK